MFLMWLRQALFLAITSLAIFLAYCLAALWTLLAKLRQRAGQVGH